MSTSEGTTNESTVDVVVVGAGMAGLYLLYKMRAMGLSARAFESADGVGGTWYWNRYPGARCDIMSIDYSYSFDPELDADWEWSEKYATQPEILAYFNHVADRYDIRRDITFNTSVDAATWDADAARWRIATSNGETTSCRFYVMATGCLSQPKQLDIDGVDQFSGDTYFTSSWPHEGVDLTGKRVGVIGTGSSGIQSIPIMAEQAEQLTVFQRTPNFSIPAWNGPIPEARWSLIDGRRPEYREEARYSRGGVPAEVALDGALQVSEEERQRRYELVWETGELLAILGSFGDLLLSEESNETLAEFIRNKIRSIVDDPVTAEALCPRDHPFGTKRPCLDSGYYETFNRPNVRLVDLRKNPITTITEAGIDTADESFDFDVIVFATGFDAMTGALVAVDITGRDGLTLADKWADGPKTYLGVTTAGFPNFFMITGPGSPSVLSNMAVSIEQHVEWTCEAIAHTDANGYDVIEPTETAEEAWVQHVNDAGDMTLYPKANSWYMGANVPGKPRVFLPYVGGVDQYRIACDEVVERDYLGFALTSAGNGDGGVGNVKVNDGIVRPLQPDVHVVLQIMAEAGMPPIESLTPEQARELMTAGAAERPPGPDVGEIVDGTYPNADGNDLEYRLYRPPTDGPHPVVVYFHGGGWVLGSHDSDDPFCREICVNSNAIVVSPDYRHAPEDRFPAAVDDGIAAVQWVADNTESLGGIAGQLAVCGWSAGGNIAAVACQHARDTGGPAIAGQVLITPVVDCDMTRQSYVDNVEGPVLTAGLMNWFWDFYADVADRTDPKASPIRAADLSGLPPALIVTAEFDPLSTEGAAYAEALQSAGVDARHVQGRGQIHTSITATDIVITSAGLRAEIAETLRHFLGAPVPA